MVLNKNMFYIVKINQLKKPQSIGNILDKTHCCIIFTSKFTVQNYT